MKKRAGIVGAAGYTGEELLKTLARHRGVEVVFATSEREAGTAVSRLYPYLPQYDGLELCRFEETPLDVDVVFLCLHAGESALRAPRFLEAGVKMIDLGADFRFYDAQAYERWYGTAHPRPDLLNRAVYGLPEHHREQIRQAALVGNPGCYPTSVLLALLPLVKAGVQFNAPIFIDSKSGVSGAGRKPSETTHFVSVNENLSPYKVGRVHRHVGEMEQELRAAGATRPIVFTPHLTPLTRGMLSTIYLQPERSMSREKVLQIWQEAYATEPFVRVMENGLPNMQTAQHTNFCFLGVESVPETGTLILFSAIDNLGKGASTQAVQNMNLMLGMDECEALL